MPLGIPPQFPAMFPSVKYVLNHSFMMPGPVATSVAVTVGLFLAQTIF